MCNSKFHWISSKNQHMPILVRLRDSSVVRQSAQQKNIFSEFKGLQCCASVSPSRRTYLVSLRDSSVVHQSAPAEEHIS